MFFLLRFNVKKLYEYSSKLVIVFVIGNDLTIGNPHMKFIVLVHN